MKLTTGRATAGLAARFVFAHSLAMRVNPYWTWICPLLGWLVLIGIWAGMGGVGVSYGNRPIVSVVQAIALVGTVLAAVHHAEVVAHRVGEPFGTLLLALAVTVIEVALIVSLMLSGKDGATTLARDTIFAAIMIILNGMVGVCLLVGGSRHHEQIFGVYGVNAALTTLGALSVITLILPNTTTSMAGPVYSSGQLIFVAIVSLVLYGGFVQVQTIRHREYFTVSGGDGAAGQAAGHGRPSRRATAISTVLLFACLVAVVLLAKSLSPSIERAVAFAGMPKAVVGIVIATIVLLPESLAALNAARANRLQTSLNLALGSALASIGLTIPAVAMVAAATGWHLELGLDAKSTVLLALSLFTSTLSLGTGRTTVLQGLIHLVIFAVFLFTTIVP